MLDKNKKKKHLAESDTLFTEFKKKLRCLYELSRIIEINEITLDEIYRKIVELVPSAWGYPEITCARLTIDGKEFKTANSTEKPNGGNLLTSNVEILTLVHY